ncbi:NAD kinase [Ornithinimicrobium sp. Arc0846-15]|nr:NAD kinase [Ornithinimicrobium laminariae]
MTRRILLVSHPGRPEVPELIAEFTEQLGRHGIEVDLLPESRVVDASNPRSATEDDDPTAAAGAELVVVFGGDGTILRGAELARPAGVPLLGVNLGRVGFLAEAEREEMSWTAERIVAGDYTVEERMTLDVEVIHEDAVICQSWAMNEATVEKAARERLLELLVEVDGRPLSSWGCDGVVMATPTGSTAYAFSGGGPVVWPDVAAILVVPISAHALFARPLVLGPDTQLAVEVSPQSNGRGVMWCDGRRAFDLPHGARVEVKRSSMPVRLARLTNSPFTDRLVAKFGLNVQGWRGAPPASQQKD